MIYVFAFIFLISLINGAPDKGKAAATGKTIVVEIDYGTVIQTEIIPISSKDGNTALEVLRMVATVKTRKVGNSIFVTTINNVTTKPGHMSWSYEVDGKSAKSLACKTIITGATHMKWIYKKNVSSPKSKG